jgi:hypothetical protein
VDVRNATPQSIQSKDIGQASDVAHERVKSDVPIIKTGATQAVSGEIILVAALLVGVFWSVSFAISYVVSKGWSQSTLNITVSIFGLSLGLITGMALRWVKQSYKITHVLLITFIWGIVYLVAQAVFNSNGVGSLLIFMAAPLATGIVLRLSEPYFTWKEILITAVGWCVAFAIGFLINRFLDSLAVLHGDSAWLTALPLFFIAGALGTAVMLSQVRR